jgi:hypothetical protein
VSDLFQVVGKQIRATPVDFSIVGDTRFRLFSLDGTFRQRVVLDLAVSVKDILQD